MAAVGGIFILIGLVAVALAGWALAKGELEWARISSRKMAAGVLAGALVLTGIGGGMQPKDDEKTVQAGAADTASTRMAENDAPASGTEATITTDPPTTATTTPASVSTQAPVTTTTRKKTAPPSTTATTAAPSTTTTAKPAPTTTTVPPTTTTTSPPAPAPQTISGTGQTLSQDFQIAGGLTSFKLTHSGASNFAVWLMNSSTGQRVDLLVNEIGAFSGSNQVGLKAGSYVLDVSADGPWKVLIEQPRYGSGPAVPTNFSGTGMTASGPFQVTKQSLVRFQMQHDGISNFAIWVLDRQGNRKELLVNEIGSFAGSKGVSLSPGVYVLQAEADGNWSVAIS